LEAVGAQGEPEDGRAAAVDIERLLGALDQRPRFFSLDVIVEVRETSLDFESSFILAKG